MAAISGATYETGRPTGVCAVSGRRLEVGEKYVAALVELKDGAGLVRMDFGQQEWEGGGRPASPARLLGFWRAVVTPAGAKKRQLVDDAALLDLFEQLEAATEARKLAFRYLLALVLVRKRLLVMEGSRAGSRATGAPAVLLVRQKGTALPPERGGDGPALIEVVDPGLDQKAMEDGTEELAAILLSGDEGGR